MKITSAEVQKKNKDRLNVYVDDEFMFAIDSLDFYNLKLNVGDEIKEDTVKNIKEVINVRNAIDKGMKLLSYKTYTSKEIRRRITGYGFSDEDADKAVEYLKEIGYINDLDFAIRCIEDLRNIKKYGKRRIADELYRKGVDKFTMEDAFFELDFEDDEDELYELVKNKLSDDFDRKNIDRIIRYFAGRGYSINTIRKCIDRAKAEYREDD